MIDPTSYRDDDTNIVLHIHDPDEHNMPSIRFGTGFFIAIFIGLLIFSGFLVATVLLFSRKQERAAAKQEQGR